MTTTQILLGMILLVLLVMLYWIGTIYYAMRKGLNEVIKGLSTMDGRLARLEQDPRRGPGRE